MLITLNDKSSAYINKTNTFITINFISKSKSITLEGSIIITIDLINKLNGLVK